MPAVPITTVLKLANRANKSPTEVINLRANYSQYVIFLESLMCGLCAFQVMLIRSTPTAKARVEEAILKAHPLLKYYTHCVCEREKEREGEPF